MRVFISSIIISILLLTTNLYAANNNRVVAFVNDDVITLYELNNRIEELTGKTIDELKAANEKEFLNTRDQVLDLMIDEKLAKEKIKELKLEADKADVDDYIEYLKEENKVTQEQLLAQLKREGITYEKFREKIKDDIERRSLIDSQIRDKLVITEDDISKYYQSHKKDYEKPGKAHIASIFLVPDSPESQTQLDELKKKGEEILARLKNGEDFGALAREFSNGPGAEEGGDLGNIKLADVAPKILKVINSLKEGEVSSLIDMGNRLQIIKLIKMNKTELIPLDKVRDSIYEALYNKELEKRYSDYMAELKKNAYTKKIF